MSYDFLTDLFRKIFVVSCVVCKGLNVKKIIAMFFFDI